MATVYNLLNGHTQSCGCRARENATTHGHAAHRTVTPTFSSWLSMIRRCTDPKFEAYEYYGEVGVTVAEAWQNFEAFLADMGERPPGTTIDRFPNASGNYEPENCRWATPTEQAWNRRSTKLVTVGGDSLPIAEWARRTGTDASKIARRLRAGWSPERAIFRNGGDR